MLDQVVIHSDKAILEIASNKSEYITVKFSSDGVHVETNPFIHTDGQDLALYFQELADHWNGWDGSRIWKSVEDDLQFDATYDILGYVNLKVSLIKNQGSLSEWKFVGVVRIEVGSLDPYAKSFKSLFASIS
ncbi:MAG: DUF6228 family protein [Oligoflexus sp.]